MPVKLLVIRMISKVQAALVAAAATSSHKVSHAIPTKCHGTPAAGIYVHSQQEQISFNPVYSVRHGTNDVTSNITGAAHTDCLQVQKILKRPHKKPLKALFVVKIKIVQ
uniref:Secreted protein n=1 Tax=Elaeophora elaphi TaxID=1147741 RepID=A0A0R3RH15_9BILA